MNKTRAVLRSEGTAYENERLPRSRITKPSMDFLTTTYGKDHAPTWRKRTSIASRRPTSSSNASIMWRKSWRIIKDFPVTSSHVYRYRIISRTTSRRLGVIILLVTTRIILVCSGWKISSTLTDIDHLFSFVSRAFIPMHVSLMHFCHAGFSLLMEYWTHCGQFPQLMPLHNMKKDIEDIIATLMQLLVGTSTMICLKCFYIDADDRKDDRKAKSTFSAGWPTPVDWHDDSRCSMWVEFNHLLSFALTRI